MIIYLDDRINRFQGVPKALHNRVAREAVKRWSAMGAVVHDGWADQQALHVDVSKMGSAQKVFQMLDEMGTACITVEANDIPLFCDRSVPSFLLARGISKGEIPVDRLTEILPGEIIPKISSLLWDTITGITTPQAKPYDDGSAALEQMQIEQELRQAGFVVPEPEPEPPTPEEVERQIWQEEEKKLEPAEIIANDLMDPWNMDRVQRTDGRE